MYGTQGIDVLDKLATSKDLVGYHRGRAAVYAAVVDLLAGGRREQLASELHASGHRLGLELASLLRHSAEPIPKNVVEERHLGELRVLGTLARECARAIHGQDLQEAAVLCDLQRSFLERHAADNLNALAKNLKSQSGQLAPAFGGWLEQFVSEETAALATVSVPRT